MIKIQTTANLYGISLMGDYQDLYELWKSIGDYLQIFIENNPSYPYHEYEYLLALNYDIRHAYMGCRGVSFEKNNAQEVGVIAESIYEIPKESKDEFHKIQVDFKNGNLYFQVEILYPLVFHYMIALGLIIDEYYQTTWFGKESSMLPDYDKLDAVHDRAVISHFLSLLWNNVKELFGGTTALSLFHYYDNCEPFFLPGIYTDALLHCQLGRFEEYDEEKKKQFLLLSFYELMDSEMMIEMPDKYCDNYELYKKTRKIFDRDQEIFPFKDTFFASLENYFSGNKTMYREDFDCFLTQTYGESSDDEPEW